MRTASLLLPLLLAAAPALPAASGEKAVNPRAELKIVESRVLWKAESKDFGAGKARFNYAGNRLAWGTRGQGDPGGQLMVAEVESGKASTLWKPPEGATGQVGEPVWSALGDLAAPVRLAEGEKITRAIVFSEKGAAPARLLADTKDAWRAAWRADGKALAFSTKTGLLLYDLQSGKAAKLLERPGPKTGPAYEDLGFCGQAVTARLAGSMRYVLIRPGEEEPLALGECRGLAPDPERGRLYLVPWLPGPTGIYRGSGVAWIDPAAKKAQRRVIAPDRPAEGEAKPYWLVDIWDWQYPSTLRISPDGETITFTGVKAGEPAANPWREFCVWRVPADGSRPPAAAAEMGPIFKRYDVGDSHGIGWRYDIDSGCFLVDFMGGRAWRLPEGFSVQRSNTDVLIDKLLVGAARGTEVVLIRLETEK